jgi:alkylation response protein AidB-like acyl-CoA dehydrogenase
VDFELSDEQSLLKDSAARFVQARCAFAERQRQRAQGTDAALALWPALAEMGWLALPFAGADGGFDGGPIETLLLMEALGPGLAAEPYLQSVVLAGELLRLSPCSDARRWRLSELMAGRCRPVLAHGEAGSRYALDAVQSRAERRAAGWSLSGAKSVVSGGAAADAFIVSARCDGDAALSLFWVAADAPGLQRRAYPTVDGHTAADLHLQEVTLPADALLGEAGQGAALLNAATDRAIAALGAEAVGLMQALLDATKAYCLSRRQFGQPIAAFQAVQHRLVDMFMAVEQTRSLALLAAIRLAESDRDAPRAVSALKVQAGKAGRFVGQQAVQLHGGMGMSDEIVIGHWFKRLLAIDAQLGNVDHHLKRFAALQRAGADTGAADMNRSDLAAG